MCKYLAVVGTPYVRGFGSGLKKYCRTKNAPSQYSLGGLEYRVHAAMCS